MYKIEKAGETKTGGDLMLVHQMEFVVLFGSVFLCAILTFIRCKENPNHDRALVAYYRNLTQSSIERKVFDGLVNWGIVPQTQYRIGKYSLDLALPKIRMDIECDGEIWHNTPQAIIKDQKRDAFMMERGWKVLRFSDTEINQNPDRVVNLIRYEINKRTH